MAGRRSTGALAGALNLATGLMAYREEEAAKQRQQAAEWVMKWKTELALEKAKHGQAYDDPLTGAHVAAVSPAIPSELTIKSYDTQTGGFTYENPLFSKDYQANKDIADEASRGSSPVSETASDGGVISRLSHWLLDRGQAPASAVPTTPLREAVPSSSPIASPPAATAIAPISPLGSGSTEDMVMVQGTDGVTYRLPRRNLQAAILRGAKPL